MSRRLLASILAGAIALFIAPPLGAETPPCRAAAELAAPQSGIAVEQICANAVPVERIERVEISDPSGKRNAVALTVHEKLPVKTSLLVPAATYVDLISEHSNRLRVRYGARATILATDPNGEAIGLDGSGGASFIVEHALNFFRVDVGRFIAAVHGTTWDVDLDQPDFATFSVSEGRVSVTRLVTVHLDKENRNVDGIRVSEYISEKDGRTSVTYGRRPELFATFANAAAARAQFNSDLDAATKNQDQVRQDDAQSNLTRLNTAFVANPNQENPGFNTAVGIGAGVGAAAAAAGTLKSTNTPPPVPQASNVPGSVTVKSTTPPAPPKKN